MYVYNAKVIRVIDADTVQVTIDLGFSIYTHQTVRLSGIDAAERNTELGKEAMKYVRNLLPLGASVILESQKSEDDKYGRYLARLLFPETKECLNDILIQKGYAVQYDGRSPRLAPDQPKLV